MARGGQVVWGKARAVRRRKPWRRWVDRLLASDRVAASLTHRLGLRGLSGPLSLAAAAPRDLAKPQGFEDLAWLFSSNYANRHLTLLMIEEAAWLYRRLRAMPAPVVAELGRAKGGTTFLLAAAGAQVLSIDDGSFERSWSQRHRTISEGLGGGLEAALDRAGLRDRVELVAGDVRSHVVAPSAFDVVIFDIPLGGRAMGEVFERWWQGVRPGGIFVLRDGREPRVPGAMALAAALEQRADVTLDGTAPGLFVVAVRH